MADMFANFSNYLRRYKPRTLGGRIFVLMMLGGLIIAVLSAMASFYVIERDERIGRAYTLGFTLRELVRIAENPEYEENIIDIAKRDGMTMRILPPDDIGTLLLFSRPAQHIPLPARLANTRLANLGQGSFRTRAIKFRATRNHRGNRKPQPVLCRTIARDRASWSCCTG